MTWKKATGWALGGLTAVVVVIILVTVVFLPAQPPRPTTAQITQITRGSSKTNLDSATITARAPNGTFGFSVLKMDRLSCQVGDTIKATEIGVSLNLDIGPCIKGGFRSFDAPLPPARKP